MKEEGRSSSSFILHPSSFFLFLSPEARRMDEWSLWFRFTVAALATWRVAHLIAREDGPSDVIVRLRARAGDSAAGRLMDCPYCLSLWIAMPFALLLANSVPGWLAGWLAVSGGASLIEKLTATDGSGSVIGG
jgi:hypothetical protein